MKPICRALIMAGLFTGFVSLQAEEIRVPSRVDSVGLFKNGLAVVSRLVEVPGPGTYLVEDVPEPVHGTFWVESTANVVARVTRRKAEVDLLSAASMDLQAALAGQEVTIHLREGNLPPIKGRVEEPVEDSESFPLDYPTVQPLSYRYYVNPPRADARRFLMIRSGDGVTFLDPGMVAYLETRGDRKPMMRMKPFLVLDVGDTSGGSAKLWISYLARGLSWSPSYRVDLSDPARMTIAQKAVIRNELVALEDAEVYLISGFPSVQFSHVISPLAAGTTWSAFFQALGRRPGTAPAVTSNIISQQAVMYNEPMDYGAAELPDTPMEEAVDVHYESIGRIDLGRGDALALEVAEAKAAYEHIVEWIVPDNRDPDGRHISDYERRNNPEKYEENAWDAVRFKNPFAFPMTTAPALVVAKGRFNGQRTSYYANAGEEMTLHINKALSLRTLCAEQEDKEERELIYIAGRRYHEAKVSGEVKVRNHRKKEMKLIIRRRFSGDLIGADGAPEVTLLEEGVYSVNRRNELVWTLDLEPGEEKRFEYQYTVLVQR